MQHHLKFAVIEFLRNSAGFETGGMKHHGHHTLEAAASIKAAVSKETGNRVQVAPPQEIAVD